MNGMARCLHRIASLSAIGLALAARCALGAPVALVTDVVGDAQSDGEPLRILAEIDVQREIALAPGSRAVVFYVGDGTEWTLAGPGRYRLAPKKPEPQSNAPAPVSREAPAPLRNLRLRQDRLSQGGILLRGGQRPALVAPVDEVVVGRDVRFAWEAAGEGTVYQFELVDEAGQRLLAAETPQTELTLPDAVTLRAGGTFYWAIRGRTAGAAPFYRATQFRTADPVTQRRVDAARPSADASFSDRVLYAALLEEVGAKSAAQAERERLAPERPARWAVAR